MLIKLLYFIGTLSMALAVVLPVVEDAALANNSMSRREFELDDSFRFDGRTYKFDISFTPRVPPEYQDWIKSAFEDAIALAGFASNMKENHPAFLNYFFAPGEHRYIPRAFNDHIRKFKDVMNVISNPNEYHFVADFDINKGTAWASTSTAPPELAATVKPFYVYIKFGPPFFGQILDKQTNRLVDNTMCLGKTRLLRNIGADRRIISPVTFYEGRGHTVLHELLHLHRIGKLANLPLNGRNDPRQGAKDWSAGDSNDSISARELKYRVEQVQSELELTRLGLINPISNAESYAAAATEYWFREKHRITRMPSSLLP